MFFLFTWLRFLSQCIIGTFTGKTNWYSST